MKTNLRVALLTGFVLSAGFVVGCGDDDKGTNPPPDNFQFLPDATQYDRVDRMGMPAVATALISDVNKQLYNADNPVDDVGGRWVPDIRARLAVIHGALDDDLTGLGLDPATVDEVITQGGALVVPDMLKLNTQTPAGFPNGRKLNDQVIDLTLAVLLLDLSTEGLNTFASLPLNPDANDVSFLNTFPYVAAKH